MAAVEKTPIWLDCDPGHDDAFAILLAAEHPRFNLLGLSTVHGNASMDKVTHNCLSLLTAIGKTNIPVYAGSRKPFMRPAVHAPAIHGESGIEGTTLLPEPAVAVQPGNAILAMRDAILATPLQSTVLVATGALTNVALLLATFPEVVTHVKEISIMGGAFGDREDCRGNITPVAEFNIYCDPEAAQSIFSNPSLSGRITLIPLDLTHTVLATSSVRAQLMPDETQLLRKMLHDLLTFFSDTYARVYGITAGPPLHDPLAVAAVLPTDEISWDIQRVPVRVATSGDEVGRTVKVLGKGEGEGGVEEVRGEELGKGGVEKDALVKIPKSCDVDAFWKVILKAVDTAEGRYQWK